MKVSSYVITYLEHLSAIGFEILFISNSPLEQHYKNLIEGTITNCKVFERKNEGADFGAWKWAIEQNIIPDDTDYLLLTNDSLYGPLFPLTPIMREMQSRTDIDFGG